MSGKHHSQSVKANKEQKKKVIDSHTGRIHHSNWVFNLKASFRVT